MPDKPSRIEIHGETNCIPPVDALAMTFAGSLGGVRLTDDDLASLLVTLHHDKVVRDAVWMAVDRALAVGAAGFFLDCLRRAPLDYRNEIACLLAHAAWMCDQRTVAVLALEAATPECIQAQLLGHAFAAGVTPEDIEKKWMRA